MPAQFGLNWLCGFREDYDITLCQNQSNQHNFGKTHYASKKRVTFRGEDFIKNLRWTDTK